MIKKELLFLPLITLAVMYCAFNGFSSAYGIWFENVRMQPLIGIELT